jgi:transcriptional regulator with XRE-family HTH domain
MGGVPQDVERTLVHAFAGNLRRERERLGLSQERLAELTDLHRTEVSLLERAGREPRLTTIVKLARGLGVAPTALLAGVE